MAIVSAVLGVSRIIDGISFVHYDPDAPWQARPRQTDIYRRDVETALGVSPPDHADRKVRKGYKRAKYLLIPVRGDDGRKVLKRVVIGFRECGRRKKYVSKRNGGRKVTTLRDLRG